MTPYMQVDGLTKSFGDLVLVSGRFHLEWPKDNASV